MSLALNTAVSAYSNPAYSAGAVLSYTSGEPKSSASAASGDGGTTVTLSDMGKRLAASTTPSSETTAQTSSSSEDVAQISAALSAQLGNIFRQAGVDGQGVSFSVDSQGNVSISGVTPDQLALIRQALAAHPGIAQQIQTITAVASYAYAQKSSDNHDLTAYYSSVASNSQSSDIRLNYDQGTLQVQANGKPWQVRSDPLKSAGLSA